ncbi:gluconate 2-dehydrogenase subunit 3 family protein [Paraglaciecola sp.]|uniref:gluconate 2-dehydrogenase subunit 3 family protein n=1 Tax=Paraglaciecola sp. TaxID=1920173 RepID=UPI003EF822C3
MDRRDILKYVAAITGTAICAPLTGALLTGCGKQVEQSTTSVTATSLIPDGQFFDGKNLEKLIQIMDVILPQTDSPSASQVKVHLIMDNMFHKIFKPDYTKNFMASFTKLTEYLNTSNFANDSADEQVTLLTQLEDSKDNSQGFKAYMDIKQQSIAYYLSTEEIAENHLNYLPIPGGYTASISVEEVGGKAWAE